MLQDDKNIILIDHDLLTGFAVNYEYKNNVPLDILLNIITRMLLENNTNISEEVICEHICYYTDILESKIKEQKQLKNKIKFLILNCNKKKLSDLEKGVFVNYSQDVVNFGITYTKAFNELIKFIEKKFKIKKNPKFQLLLNKLINKVKAHNILLDKSEQKFYRKYIYNLINFLFFCDKSDKFFATRFTIINTIIHDLNSPSKKSIILDILNKVYNAKFEQYDKFSIYNKLLGIENYDVIEIKLKQELQYLIKYYAINNTDNNFYLDTIYIKFLKSFLLSLFSEYKNGKNKFKGIYKKTYILAKNTIIYSYKNKLKLLFFKLNNTISKDSKKLFIDFVLIFLKKKTNYKKFEEYINNNSIINTNITLLYNDFNIQSIKNCIILTYKYSIENYYSSNYINSFDYLVLLNKLNKIDVNKIFNFLLKKFDVNKNKIKKSKINNYNFTYRCLRLIKIDISLNSINNKFFSQIKHKLYLENYTSFIKYNINTFLQIIINFNIFKSNELNNIDNIQKYMIYEISYNYKLLENIYNSIKNELYNKYSQFIVDNIFYESTFKVVDKYNINKKNYIKIKFNKNISDYITDYISLLKENSNIVSNINSSYFQILAIIGKYNLNLIEYIKNECKHYINTSANDILYDNRISIFNPNQQCCELKEQQLIIIQQFYQKIKNNEYEIDIEKYNQIILSILKSNVFFNNDTNDIIFKNIRNYFLLQHKDSDLSEIEDYFFCIFFLQLFFGKICNIKFNKQYVKLFSCIKYDLCYWYKFGWTFEKEIDKIKHVVYKLIYKYNKNNNIAEQEKDFIYVINRKINCLNDYKTLVKQILVDTYCEVISYNMNKKKFDSSVIASNFVQVYYMIFGIYIFNRLLIIKEKIYNDINIIVNFKDNYDYNSVNYIIQLIYSKVNLLKLIQLTEKKIYSFEPNDVFFCFCHLYSIEQLDFLKNEILKLLDNSNNILYNRYGVFFYKKLSLIEEIFHNLIEFGFSENALNLMIQKLFITENLISNDVDKYYILGFLHNKSNIIKIKYLLKEFLIRINREDSNNYGITKSVYIQYINEIYYYLLIMNNENLILKDFDSDIFEKRLKNIINKLIYNDNSSFKFIKRHITFLLCIFGLKPGADKIKEIFNSYKNNNQNSINYLQKLELIEKLLNKLYSYQCCNYKKKFDFIQSNLIELIQNCNNQSLFVVESFLIYIFSYNVYSIKYHFTQLKKKLENNELMINKLKFVIKSILNKIRLNKFLSKKELSVFIESNINCVLGPAKSIFDIRRINNLNSIFLTMYRFDNSLINILLNNFKDGLLNLLNKYKSDNANYKLVYSKLENLNVLEQNIIRKYKFIMDTTTLNEKQNIVYNLIYSILNKENYNLSDEKRLGEYKLLFYYFDCNKKLVFNVFNKYFLELENALSRFQKQYRTDRVKHDMEKIEMVNILKKMLSTRLKLKNIWSIEKECDMIYYNINYFINEVLNGNFKLQVIENLEYDLKDLEFTDMINFNVEDEIILKQKNIEEFLSYEYKFNNNLYNVAVDKLKNILNDNIQKYKALGNSSNYIKYIKALEIVQKLETKFVILKQPSFITVSDNISYIRSKIIFLLYSRYYNRYYYNCYNDYILEYDKRKLTYKCLIYQDKETVQNVIKDLKLEYSNKGEDYQDVVNYLNILERELYTQIQIKEKFTIEQENNIIIGSINYLLHTILNKNDNITTNYLQDFRKNQTIIFLVLESVYESERLENAFEEIRNKYINLMNINRNNTVQYKLYISIIKEINELKKNIFNGNFVNLSIKNEQEHLIKSSIKFLISVDSNFEKNKKRKDETLKFLRYEIIKNRFMVEHLFIELGRELKINLRNSMQNKKIEEEKIINEYLNKLFNLEKNILSL